MNSWKSDLGPNICGTNTKLYPTFYAIMVNVLKILNTIMFLFSNTMLVFRAGIHKLLVSIANREDPDQTAPSEAV